jgi:hypothetical protein
MKTNILTVILVINSFLCFSANKLLLETERSVSNISLINSKSGKTQKIMPWRSDKTSFLFEVDALEDIFLKFPANLQIRLYSFAQKISSGWQSVKKEEAVAVKSFFATNTTKNVELDDFLIKSFISNPLTSQGSNLRSDDCPVFFTPDNTRFSSPAKLMIKWCGKKQILKLQIIDMANNSEIFSQASVKDTVLDQSRLPEKVRTRLNFQTNYALNLTADEAEKGETVYSLNFSFGKPCFSKPKEQLIFVSKEIIEIAWEAEPGEVLVNILDEHNAKVFTEKMTKNKISHTNLVNLNLKTRKPYKFTVTQNEKSISCPFVILQTEQEMDKLRSKLAAN